MVIRRFLYICQENSLWVPRLTARAYNLSLWAVKARRSECKVNPEPYRKTLCQKSKQPTTQAIHSKTGDVARWQSTCLIAQGRGLHSYYTEQMASEATPITLPPKPWDVSLCIADNVAVDHLTKVAPAEFATPQLCFSLHDQWDPCRSLCSSPGSHHTPVHWFLVSFGYSGLRWLLL